MRGVLKLRKKKKPQYIRELIYQAKSGSIQLAAKNILPGT